MKTQLPQRNPRPTIVSLTERHYQEWLDLLAYLQQAQASAKEIARCQFHLAQLQDEWQRLSSR